MPSGIQPLWRFLITDLDGKSITLLDHLASERMVTLKLNDAAEVTGTSVVDSTSAFNTITGRILSSGQNLLWGTYSILFLQGDKNVQYNTDGVPVTPFMFQPLFGLGVLMLLAQWRRPRSWLLLPLLFLPLQSRVYITLYQ